MLIENYSDIIYGIKIHPFHSQLAFNDKKMEPVFKLAQKYNLVIISHTMEICQYSHPTLVYEVAKKYQNINFVLVHMVIMGDHKLSIK